MFATPDNPRPDRADHELEPPSPKATGSTPTRVYRFNIDNDGDALPDVAFSFTFSEPDDGRQTVTAHYATGSDAQTREPCCDVLIQATPVGSTPPPPVQAGPCRLFIGKRSEPFFADAEGVLHWLVDGAAGNYQWTATDTFAGANTYSIVLEAPKRHARPRAADRSMDRDQPAPRRHARSDGPEGNPSFNPILNPNGIKDEFNATDPVDDLKNHLQPLSETLQQHGYPPDQARAAALTLLPDGCQ